MNENEQTVEVAEEQSVSAPQVEIDYDRLSSGLAEKLHQSQQERTPEPQAESTSFEDMDYDQRDQYLAKETQSTKNELQAMSVRQQAFMRSGEAEQSVLQSIPENMRGEAQAHVKAYVGQLMEANPQLLAQGLPDNVKDEIASISVGKVYRAGKLPSQEPSAKVATDEVPFYDEIVTAFKESGLPVPAHEEIVRRSKTWGNTRAS